MNKGYRNVDQVIKRKLKRYENPKKPLEIILKKTWTNIHKLYQEINKKDIPKSAIIYTK